jgi:VanZ family protein
MMCIAAWLLLAVVITLSLVPPAWRPVSGLPHDLEHAAIFLAMGLAFARAYPGHRYALALTAIMFVGVLEMLQRIVPGRHARMSDFAVDAASVCIGIAAASLFTRKQPA